MLLKFQDTIAGPRDLAGFIDPPETGLKYKSSNLKNEKSAFKKWSNLTLLGTYPVISTASPIATPTTNPDKLPNCSFLFKIQVINIKLFIYLFINYRN